MDGLLILLCLAAYLGLTGGLVVTCNNTDYQVFNDANFTMQEAKVSCKLVNSKLLLETEANDLYHCEPGLLERKIYWIQGTDDNCTAIFHGRWPFMNIHDCNGRHPTICTRPSPPRPPTSGTTDVVIQHDTTELSAVNTPTPTPTDMAIQNDVADTDTSTQRWETIPRNNTFIHIVKEGLTQQKAILGCEKWFNGSLLHMSIDELFLDLSNVTLHGHYWINDIEDSNLTEDCLVYSRLGDQTSITTINSDEKHFCVCASLRQLKAGKPLWKMKKLLVTSNFFISHNVFYPLRP